MTHHTPLSSRVAAFLRKHPNRWIRATEFESIGGRQGWRTRLSDCRLRGMTIENRVRVVQTAQGKRKVSEYRYVEPTGQGSLFSASVVRDKVTRGASVHVVGTSHD